MFNFTDLHNRYYKFRYGYPSPRVIQGILERGAPPKSFTPRFRTVTSYYAVGEPPDRIALLLGCSTARVRQMLLKFERRNK